MLTVDEKLEVLDLIGKKSYAVISEEYGIGCATITDIKKKGDELKKFKSHLTDMGMKRPSKVMRLGKNREHDEAVFLWFKQKRAEGVPVTGPILKAKAVDLHKKLCEARRE